MFRFGSPVTAGAAVGATVPGPNVYPAASSEVCVLLLVSAAADLALKSSLCFSSSQQFVLKVRKDSMWVQGSILSFLQFQKDRVTRGLYWASAYLGGGGSKQSIDGDMSLPSLNSILVLPLNMSIMLRARLVPFQAIHMLLLNVTIAGE